MFYMINNKKSLASRAYWKSIPKEKRSSIMSIRAKERWNKTTFEERQAYSYKLIKAKQCKKINK